MDAFNVVYGMDMAQPPIWYDYIMCCLVFSGLFCIAHIIFNKVFKNVKYKISKIFLVVFIFSSLIAIGTDKSPVFESIFRVLYYPFNEPWALKAQSDGVINSAIHLSIAEDLMDEVDNILGDTPVCYISFDWHAPNRLPNVDGRQNVMGWVTQVIPTNINDILYEDHYVAFSAQAADSPSIILIEYAQTQDDGSILRYTSEVQTNSFPEQVTVSLDSGDYDCYWFRCEVPSPFVNIPRDWSGEVLFGSPIGSGRGFDLMGILVIDDGNDVWVGDSGVKNIAGVDYVFTNGICLGVSE